MKKLEFFRIPRIVVFGPDAVSKIPDVVQDLNLGRSRAVVVHGSGATAKIAENMVLPRVREVFSDVVTYVVGKGDFSEMVNDILSFVSRMKSDGADVVFGVGGGRVIDFAKVAAALMKAHFISVPTSASHDGIASPALSFLLRRALKEKGIGLEYVPSPLAIVADTKIICGAPKRLLAAGCGDLVSKITAVRDWRLAHLLKGEDFSEYAASLAKSSAFLVMKHADIIAKGLEEGVRVVVKGLIGCGVAMSIAGSSRPCSGAEHLFSHALDLLSVKYGFKPAYHGEQVGVGTIMMAYLHGLNWRRIRKFLKSVGAPVTAEELGIEPKYIVEALTIAHRIRPNRYTILGESGLTWKAAVKLAKVTGVIPEDAKL